MPDRKNDKTKIVPLGLSPREGASCLKVPLPVPISLMLSSTRRTHSVPGPIFDDSSNSGGPVSAQDPKTPTCSPAEEAVLRMPDEQVDRNGEVSRLSGADAHVFGQFACI
jgi:hypothetical protein